MDKSNLDDQLYTLEWRVSFCLSEEVPCQNVPGTMQVASLHLGTIAHVPLRSPFPAVKITHAPPPPITPSIDSMMLPASMCPDPCLSLEPSNSPASDEKTGEEQKVASTTSIAFDKEQEVIPSLLKDEVTEFDNFLLDAVQWL